MYGLVDLIIFLFGWLISSLIIYIVSKLLGEKKGFGTAVITAFIGFIIFTVANRISFLLTPVAIIIWIIALMKIYDIGLFKAILMAILIYFASIIISFIGLPKIL
ncbi:MAG: hypothetical protein DRJ34_00985 [Thermoprotei archaeon]|nr:MAG: hypothetical protein DRJ34_00985 [Thermoprotei archaeon]